MMDYEKDTLIAQVQEKHGILSHLDNNDTSANQRTAFWAALNKAGSPVCVTKVDFQADWTVAVLSKEPLTPASVQEWTEAMRAPTED